MKMKMKKIGNGNYINEEGKRKIKHKIENEKEEMKIM